MRYKERIIPGQRASSSRGGSALLVVVMLLAAIGVLLGSLFAGTNARLSADHAQWRKEIAHALAEAGIEAASVHLAETGGGYLGDHDVVVGQGTYSTSVLPTNVPGEFIVTASGDLRDGRVRQQSSTITARIRIKDRRISEIDYLLAPTPQVEVP